MTNLSTDQVISDMHGWTDLKAYFEGVRGGIDNSVQDALDAISASIKYFTVDQVNGDDNNAGTDASPLASFNKAFQRTPVGGVCYIKLKNDYHMNLIAVSENLAVHITGVGQPKITFDWVDDVNNPGQITRLASFQPSFRGQYHFSHLDVEFPSDPPEPFTYTHMNGLIANSGFSLPAMMSAKFINVNFYNPGGGTRCSLFAQALSFIAVRFSGGSFPSGFEGRIRDGIGGVGVDPDTVSRFISTNYNWI